MKVIIEICTDNEAFSDSVGAEVSRILRKLTTDIDTGDDFDDGFSKPLFDINGNKCGSVRTEE
jgi:hypothetical protein